MIWIRQRSDGVSGSSVVSALTAACRKACGKELAANDGLLANLGTAVERYLETQGCGGAHSESIVLLASRALDAMGHGLDARRMLLFGTGLVVPERWTVGQGDEVWVLNLARFANRDRTMLELTLFGGVRLSLEILAEVWDAGSGRGILGLRGIQVVAGAVTPTRNKARKRIVSDEVRDFCREKLHCLSCERGWREVPRILDLDVRANAGVHAEWPRRAG
jgi:hypothetical protein